MVRADLTAASAAERRNTVPWIVAYAHKPMYCSTDDYYDCQVSGPLKIRPVIEPLLAEFGVDLFLAGHLQPRGKTVGGLVERRSGGLEGQGHGKGDRRQDRHPDKDFDQRQSGLAGAICPARVHQPCQLPISASSPSPPSRPSAPSE